MATMKTVNILYGKTSLPIEVDAHSSVLVPRLDELTSSKMEDDIVLASLAAPIASPRLYELARGRKNAVVIISDHTRPVPSRHIIPHMLAELRRGNPDIDITLLVATGCHRGTTAAELAAKLGEDIASHERIVVHDCASASDNVEIGTLPSGARLVINRLAAEADLLVSEGFIEPHFFAGFSGGRKSVLPGICDRVTVYGNHCAAFIANENARTGILENNPIHADMLAAARLARLAFIANVVIDEDKRAVACFAGDPFAAHAEGCRFIRGYCAVKAAPADIVISSNGGAPLDQNLYQSVKGMTAAEATANEGAVIIMCAECADGIGGDSFYREVKRASSPAALLNEIAAVPMDKTIADQWQYQILARVLDKHRVIFVTRPELKNVVAEMKMQYAATLGEAMAAARAIKGESASLTAIPNGVSLIVER